MNVSKRKSNTEETINEQYNPADLWNYAIFETANKTANDNKMFTTRLENKRISRIDYDKFFDEKRFSSPVKNKNHQPAKVRHTSHTDKDIELDPKSSRVGKVGAAFLLKQFTSNTSIAGLPNFARSQQTIRSWFWILVVLAGTGLLAWQMTIAVRKYLSWDTQTVIRYTNEQEMPFPAITICNINPIQMSKIKTENKNMYRYLKSLVPVMASKGDNKSLQPTTTTKKQVTQIQQTVKQPNASAPENLTAGNPPANVFADAAPSIDKIETATTLAAAHESENTGQQVFQSTSSYHYEEEKKRREEEEEREKD